MPTRVALSAPELRLLQSLRGQPLDALFTDGWTIQLHSGRRTLLFLPEEVDGPDDVLLPDADVVRLRVEERRGAGRVEPVTELARGLGIIRRMASMSVGLSFRLPGGDGAGAAAEDGTEPPRPFHPDELAAGEAERPQTQARSVVDVGVALETDRGWALIATDGWGFRVFAALGNAPEERLAPLTGKVRLDPLFSLAGQPA